MEKDCPPPSVHASCVRVGEVGVLIRGESGSGKSHLAFALILAGGTGPIPPVQLVADDRVRLAAGEAGLFAAPPDELAGLIEVRGAGLRRLAHVPRARIGLVVDLGATDAARLPAEAALRTRIEGVDIDRLPVLAGGDAVQQVLAALLTARGY
ncbi:HPr kinase/phosphatase C-terminal domain-containing protein [Ancylobacter sp. MQZ15Z-1]|uniref:HPr kinase/phosphatase C-terminal domain-containing protein n=1 Tax=Ancylobacter mangrovi TaxID=2972472 RepID=A0A9X2T3U3_9HYPH|nr:HPr kinase/phosphatase C-terminal domain-containing protein [Ancylobacter mangrovi]MCS0495336.1 HPr kinase/phosphatase C-terminal domain-containing protein [Ancylobacter mangrovi]